jgi:hypothetical protein
MCCRVRSMPTSSRVQGSDWSHGSHISASSVAFSIVLSSTHSMSLPTGVPMSVRVTLAIASLCARGYTSCGLIGDRATECITR